MKVKHTNKVKKFWLKSFKVFHEKQGDKLISIITVDDAQNINKVNILLGTKNEI